MGEFCDSFVLKQNRSMKKLKHYPTVWQAYPFSMDMFAHFEADAKRASERSEIEREVKKARKPRLKLAFGW